MKGTLVMALQRIIFFSEASSSSQDSDLSWLSVIVVVIKELYEVNAFAGTAACVFVLCIALYPLLSIIKKFLPKPKKENTVSPIGTKKAVWYVALHFPANLMLTVLEFIITISDSSTHRFIKKRIALFSDETKSQTIGITIYAVSTFSAFLHYYIVGSISIKECILTFCISWILSTILSCFIATLKPREKRREQSDR
jgi:hypothetical protein